MLEICLMRKLLDGMLILWWSIMILFPFFVNAEDVPWTTQACAYEDDALSGKELCKQLSFDYTKPYCVTSNLDYAEDCLWKSLNNTWSESLKSADSLYKALEWYCKIMLSDRGDWRIYYARPNLNITDTSENPNNWDWQQTFDSHQSLFVYALCSSFEDEEWNRPLLFWTDILWDAFTWENVSKVLKLQQRSGKKDLCSIVDNEWIPDCENSIYATEIFTAIMSDLFKIEYAQVLHVDSVKNFEDKETRILAFLSWYFNITDEYTNVQPLYPQTIEVIDSNQEYYKKVLSTIKLLNNEKLVERVEKTGGCPLTWNMEWVDFIACALHWTQWKDLALDPAFVTLFYNEMMNYRVFKSYLGKWFDIMLENVSKKKINEKEVRILQSKALDFQLYANMQLEAAERTLLDLEDLNMTYPYHIWLLLYQEKVKKFRDFYLSPIVTIFYSLSEKLQNVQIPNEQ